MSTNKRQNNNEEALKANDEPRSSSLRKKPRLSSLKAPVREEEQIEPVVVRDDGYRPPSAPMRLFRRHYQLNFISEEVRSSNQNRAPLSEHTQTFMPFSPNSFPYSGPPRWFDVSPELQDAILPVDGEMSFWKAEHTAFINSAAGLEGAHWIGKRPLGSGAFGTAGLWERRDENNVVIEVSRHVSCILLKG